MYRQLTVIGTGSGKAENLSFRALREIKSADHVLLRTCRMPVSVLLQEQNIAFKSLDACYEEAEDFEQLNELIYEELCSFDGNCCYLVFGSGLDDRTAAFILSHVKEQGYPCALIPGVALADSVAAAFGYPCSYTACTALDGAEKVFDVRANNIITCIDSPLIAGDLKCRLLEYYDAELTVDFYMEDEQGNDTTASFPLYQLDRQPLFHHTACLFIKEQKLSDAVRYDYRHLVEIMARLRGQDGCPWDKEQTHASLKPYLLEESYEALDAIDEGDTDKLYDELGDVLLQVVFHAQVAQEHGEFTERDITNAVCAKMIHRHPHIFGNVKADTSEQVLINWEAIKREEKQLKSHADVLHDVPKAFPALLRAQKIQQKAAKAGFDWADFQGAFEKLPEEFEELKAAFESNDPSLIDEEMGDLLFTIVNIARHAGVQPELALYQSTQKFISRFTRMEQLILGQNKVLQEMTLAEMDMYWDEAKALLKGEK